MTRKVWIVIAIGVLIFTIIEIVTLGGWVEGSTPHIVFSTGGKLRLAVGLYLEHFVSVLVGIVVGNVIAGKGVTL